MKQTVKYHLTGEAPLMMHNGQLADPLNLWTKAIKKITDKRKKTDADFEEVGRLEWMGSLYLFNGAPCIPREAVKATLLNAAKTLRKGTKVKPGLVCEQHAPLLYDGAREVKALWEDARFVDRRSKSMRGQRVMRTRPIFFPWQADILLAFNDEMLNPEEVEEIVVIAGHSIGLLDERPDYGRYTAKKL